MGKFQCTSDDYTYDWEDIEKDFEELRKEDRGYFEEYLEDETDPDVREEKLHQFDEDFDAMLEELGESCYDGHQFTPAFIELVEKYDCDWWESRWTSIGKRISQRVYLWSVGFRMAVEQLEAEENR